MKRNWPTENNKSSRVVYYLIPVDIPSYYNQLPIINVISLRIMIYLICCLIYNRLAKGFARLAKFLIINRYRVMIYPVLLHTFAASMLYEICNILLLVKKKKSLLNRRHALFK